MKKNQKLYWKMLNKIMPTGKDQGSSSSDIKELFTNDGNLISSENTANYINHYFTGIGVKLASNITLDNSDYILNLRQQLQTTTILDNWRHTTVNEIKELILDVNVDKKSQVESIDSKFLKDCMLLVLPELVHLFNLIFDSGIFPDVWKYATIVPLFKAGNKKMVENYRPISLLPSVAKIFEKIIHRRIHCYLVETSYLTEA